MTRSTGKKDKFEKLRQARTLGKQSILEDEEDEDVLFDQVDEDTYKRALVNDDFVVDDNGTGYVDYGQEESEHYSSEDEKPVKNTKKRKQELIKDSFSNQKKIKPISMPVAPVVVQDDTDLLNSLMNEIDDSVQQQIAVHPMVRPGPSSTMQVAASIFAQPVTSVGEPDMPMNESEYEPQAMVEDAVKEKEAELKQEVVDNNYDEPIVAEKPKVVNINPNVQLNVIQSQKKTLSVKPQFVKPQVATGTNKNNNQDWNKVKTSIKVADNPIDERVVDTKGLLQDETLRMFWIDACEINGLVYLFGKVLNKETNKHVSCCVVVENIARNLFVLPRSFAVDKDGQQTDSPVSFEDLFNEFETIMDRHNIKNAAFKPVKKGYAFDDVPNVPAESTFLKVVYGFDQPMLPLNMSGSTFSHVFGTNTSAMELLILKRKLMGPCWLDISNCKINSKNISWCKLEVSISSPKDIKVVADCDDIPPLNIMSITIKTAADSNRKINEIIGISLMVHEELPVETTLESNKTSRQWILLRQWNNIPIPEGIKESGLKIEMYKTERHLLNYFLALLHKIDPDVLVGHNFIGFGLDVLLHRLKFHKIELQWSKIGRLRRTRWPKLQAGAGGMGESSFAEKQTSSGRLMCDTYLMAKDLVKSKNYSLTELASFVLNFNRRDFTSDEIIERFWSLQGICELGNCWEGDSWLVLALMFKLQMIPLTLQLTKLAGNLWARTMTGARAERNEYLLLHEFHQRKFILPDKINTYNKNEDDGGEKKGRKKPSYEGGLVLEPKKGFYDKFVLLLDFNSLYPSIIQEYNICFTTVTRNDLNSDQVPDAPEPDLTMGILPKLIANLVNRRRQVKNLMKDPKITNAEKTMFDIRQKALKLTANSMYGCLGFTHSRFYAKQLAMLVTAKGREILQATVDMATEQGLQVIYGDTDSIMIYTNTDDFNLVKKIGNEFKTLVNKRYRLLEIEMDGMFKRMLLLKKKKYAALVLEETIGKSFITRLETKGLEEVRRDWSEVSKEASNFVLNQLFSDVPREESIENIHQFLSSLANNIRQGFVGVDKFVIHKGLTKNPEDYADKKSQPHVQVALQLKSRGVSVKVNDTIPFVICESVQGGSDLIAARAYHPDDVKREGSILKIDYEWYISNQIHPPVSRLCEPIEETDASRIADCLGLDAKKYNKISTGEDLVLFEEKLYTLESQMSDQERFKNVVPWEPKCRHCGNCQPFSGVYANTENGLEIGLKCLNCSKIMNTTSLYLQLGAAIRNEIEKFKEQELVCDEAVCGLKTRQICVRARQCPSVGCRGFLTLQYGYKQLLTRLQYYSSLFDVKKQSKNYNTPEAIALINEYENDYKTLKGLVDQYLSKNSARSVNLEKLFSFMTV